MIKNLVFDLGGILVDLSFPSSVEYFRPYNAAGLDLLLSEMDENHFFTRCQAGEFSTSELISFIQSRCEKQISAEEVSYGWNLCLRGIPMERIELIRRLRRKYRVFMLSNICELHWDYINRSFFEGQNMPTGELFDELFLSYRMGMVKPDAVIYDELIRRTGIIPGETLYLDDLLPNIEAGKRAGLNTFQPPVSKMGSDGEMHMAQGEWSRSKDILSLL